MFGTFFRRSWITVLSVFLVLAPCAAAKPTIPAEDLRADFEQLYAGLREAHYDLYGRVDEGDYDRLYRVMLADMDESASPSEAAVLFQKFVAFGKIAHANIDAISGPYGEYRRGGGKAFPISFRIIEGHPLVTEDYSGLAPIDAGDEILSINGEAMPVWLDRACGHLSADTTYMAHSLLEVRFPALLWLELGGVDGFDLSLRKPDGRVLDLAVPATTRAALLAQSEAEPAGLTVDWNAREARMLGEGVAYLRPGPFYNITPGAEDVYDNAAFRDFIDGAFESFLASGAENLIVDLRNNPGGDNSFSDLMVAWFADKPFKFASDFRIKVSRQAIESNQKRVDLSPDAKDDTSHRLADAYARAEPGEVISFDIAEVAPRPGRRFEGKVYLLVNRHSYSNTVSVAALVQDYGFGTIIGEETADLATTYGAMESFELPHTGLKISFPKAHIIRPNGDETPRGVVPDYVIATPLVENAEDPVLKQAVAFVLRNR